ncbi:hypothetical protein [Aquirufa rosea]|uniref:Tetratricopeptide repeat protein n=1 Tax=Aquirufa rosea TaxID=2509241 RepID=A0A4V1M5E2_9BACT|nr:hypothetical protein [Aquirufa rosea]RXK48826.1 hypothetical protein ESB04_07675 [Aquirufa rosea]
MKDLKDFKATLTEDNPPKNLSVQLKSLWYDAQGDWDKAHDQVDQLMDRESAWVHAYLHRKEGDMWNADYWYNRAKKTRPNVSLDNEWQNLAEYFLSH